MTPTARDLLRAIGVGNFNATMIIQFMFIAPATTDPKSAPIILLVKHLQMVINQLAPTPLPVNGYIDNQTADAFETIAGPGWEQRPWSDLVQAVLRAKNQGITWRDDPPPPSNFGPSTMKLGSFGPLPDVPGGVVTYGIGAYLLYRWFKNRKKR